MTWHHLPWNGSLAKYHHAHGSSLHVHVNFVAFEMNRLNWIVLMKCHCINKDRYLTNIINHKISIKKTIHFNLWKFKNATTTKKRKTIRLLQWASASKTPTAACHTKSIKSKSKRIAAFEGLSPWDSSANLQKIEGTQLSEILQRNSHGGRRELSKID